MEPLNPDEIPPTTKSPTVKLRGSCHACAQSKLKCSQDKPTCVRCAKRGTTCHYLASKRAGRKQGSRTGSIKSPIKTERSPTSPGEDDDRKGLLAASAQLMKYALQQDRNLHAYGERRHHQRTPSYPDSVPSLLSPAGPATSATTPHSFSNPDFDSFLATPVSLSLLEVPDVDYFAGADVSFTDLNGFPNPTSFSMPENPLPVFEDGLQKPLVSKMPYPMSDLSSSSPLTEKHDPSNNPLQCSCFIRSLSLLRGLFPNPSFCYAVSIPDTTNSSSLPTIQQVISQNEQTIREISHLLDCPSPHDGYTLTVQTLTVFKVMAWYRIAQDSPLLNETQPQHPEQMDKGPTEIRGYRLNGDGHGRMASQLVLGELHRVQSLVNTLSERVKEQGTRHELFDKTNSVGVDEHESILPVYFLDQLAVDLRTRLRGLSREIVDRLRRG